ncbi:endopolygalacturonase [Cantharellus anzutake]|uniref:endopolygalacturonase n=1 Tax=Cantharellus anzutake TaxID=1750568 RepID=UPI001902DE39|nr:endopolygalacturonase [Cantharellus anzutake]KAF8326801.1 endopolygalacturonase [Cantharellus anzutake]
MLDDDQYSSQLSEQLSHDVRRASGTHSARQAACTVNSVSSASDLSDCTSVVIEAFTVPSGKTITIKAAPGAVVSQTGAITFAKTTASGPLLTIATTNVTYDGNGHNINGNGWLYWDGKGAIGRGKPHPLVKLQEYGTFQSFTVLDSPAHAISVGTTGPSTIQHVTVDNSAGNKNKLGVNTDGFDISASDVTLCNNTVINQDDCVAINNGSNILVQYMTCVDGHGLSIGSVSSGDSVSNVIFRQNTVMNSANGLRIKVKAHAENSFVSNVVYDGNIASNISKYGFILTQSYPEVFGKAGTKAPITGISFTGSTNSVSVASKAYSVGVNCGNCQGVLDFTGLQATGGRGRKLVAQGVQIQGLGPN